MPGWFQIKTLRQSNTLMTALLLMAGLVSQAHASLGLEQQYRLRVAASSAVGHLLMYLNPRFDNHSEAVRQMWADELQQLLPLASQDAISVALVQRIAADVEALEGMEADQQYLYPVVLNRILKTQAELDSRLAATSARTDVGSLLRELGVQIAFQNQVYQAALFGSLGVYLYGGAEDIASQISQRIDAALTGLQQQSNQLTLDQQQLLERLQSRYRFIQPHVTDVTNAWVPNLVARYSQDMLAMVAQMTAQKRGL